MIRLAVVGGLALVVGACGTSPSEAETAATASWFAPIAAVEDPFFSAFALGAPSSYWADDAEWYCISESVVKALDTPATRDALSQLDEMASSEGPPLSRKLEAVEVLARLPSDERIRIGGIVIDVARRCGDVRVNLFAGGGGPGGVCLYDRSSDELRARIVAYSMLTLELQLEEEFDAEAVPILQDCWALLQAAEENGEELDWVRDLDQRFHQQWEERSKNSAD